MAGFIYVPWLLSSKVFALEWHGPGWVVFNYGELLTVLPGMALIAWLAPRVAYRRRDALLLLLPPWGLRIGWVIGARLGQLPHRDWPERTDTFPVQGRYMARIAVAANRYRSWRQRRARVASLTQQEPSDREGVADRAGVAGAVTDAIDRA
jgi:hypothetical protein